MNYVELGLALALEGTSLQQVTRQVRAEDAGHDHDPTPRAVFTEDLAAVIGILLAAAGPGCTGSADWDDVASLAIGVLLAIVAILLAKSCKGLLIVTDKMLLCAPVDFVDTYSAGDIDEIFIEPVPRSEPDLRDRVRRRSGRSIADAEPLTGFSPAAPGSHQE